MWPLVLAAGIAATSQLMNNLSTNKANQANLDFANKQFNEQKFLNRNQIQLQTADAMKAGINPAALNTSSLSSGSFQSNQQPNDYSAFADTISNLVTAKMQADTQKDINEANIQAQKDIANSNNANTLKLEGIKQFYENARESARLQQQAIQNYLSRKFEKLKWKDTFGLENARFKDSVKSARMMRAKNSAEYYSQLQSAYATYKRGNRESSGGLFGPLIDAMYQMDLLDEKGMSFKQFWDAVNSFINKNNLW